MANLQEPKVPNLNFDPMNPDDYVEGNEEPEIVYLKDGDGIPDENNADAVDPEVERLRLENEELQRKADVSNSIHSALVELKNQPAPVVQAAPATPQKTAAEIAEELSEQMLVDPVGATEKVIDKYMAPKLNAIYSVAFKLAKKNAANDPTYQEYGSEVEAYIKSLPPAHQNNPEVYEYAIQQVKNRHIDDIISKEVEKKIAEMAGKNSGLGGQPQIARSNNVANFTPGGNGISVPKPNKKKVYLTAQDKFQLEERSKRTGIPMRLLEEDFINSKGGGR